MQLLLLICLFFHFDSMDDTIGKIMKLIYWKKKSRIEFDRRIDLNDYESGNAARWCFFSSRTCSGTSLPTFSTIVSIFPITFQAEQSPRKNRTHLITVRQGRQGQTSIIVTCYTHVSAFIAVVSVQFIFFVA